MNSNDRLVDLAAETRESIRLSVDMLRRVDHVSGITTSQLVTLNALEDGPLTMSELAEAKDVAQPTVSQHVSRLEGWGHVRRVSTPEDGRIVRVELTQHGKEVAEKANRARDEVVAAALEQLSEEQHSALHEGISILRGLAEQFLESDQGK
ncbi:MarR family winged helix-turn-helix transcriptional regulator [Corynebacterium sp.]|uniref:MarR family winged helix-turn-helix transcriptional regulator n=1 Tax=Corynebacterium sp. TaxID=1720 RepID=UPI0026189506|nr:MarR family transcriptional regulator [Corynebacterium sp.]